MTDVYVRALKLKDLSQVEKLDNESDSYLSQIVEDDEDDNVDFTWGLFRKNEHGEELIGYCTIGESDGVLDEEDKLYLDLKRTDTIGLILSDVYITEKYRHQGYGSIMVMDAIAYKREFYEENTPIYISILDEKLVNFYQPLGFVPLGKTPIVEEMILR